MASIKLSISGVPRIASTSAVADYLDADKHLNLGKATTAGKKVEAAAERFRKAHAKGDAVAARVLGKIEGVRTPRQIEKALQPVGYYVVRKSAKTENFSAVKNKNQDATYLRKRAFRVSQRKTLSDMYTVLFPVYHAQILDKEAKALQRDLIAAVATHMKGMEGTKAKATKITADNNAAEVADYQGSMKVLKSVLTGADKLKEAALFEFTPERGKPALYLNVPGAGFLVVRHCTRAAFLKAKKAGATKSQSASGTMSAAERSKKAYDTARANATRDIPNAARSQWNKIVTALGHEDLKVTIKRFTHMGMPQAIAATGEIAPGKCKAWKMISMGVSSSGLYLSGSPRSFMGSQYEHWGIINSLPMTLEGVVKGLKKAGIKVSAEAVKSAKAKLG